MQYTLKQIPNLNWLKSGSSSININLSTIKLLFLYYVNDSGNNWSYNFICIYTVCQSRSPFSAFSINLFAREHFKIIENIIPSLTAAVLHIKIAFIAQWVGYKHICRLTKQQIIGRIGLRGMDRASVNGSEVAINGWFSLESLI